MLKILSGEVAVKTLLTVRFQCSEKRSTQKGDLNSSLTNGRAASMSFVPCVRVKKSKQNAAIWYEW